MYYDEEAEKKLIAHYEILRAEILRQIQQNQQNKTRAIQDIDEKIARLMKTFPEMIRQKVGELREIEQFNKRVELVGLRRIEVNDVEQRGNVLNSEVKNR